MQVRTKASVLDLKLPELAHALLSPAEEKQLGVSRVLSLPYKVSPAPSQKVVRASRAIEKLQDQLVLAKGSEQAAVLDAIAANKDEIKTILKPELKIPTPELMALALEYGFSINDFNSESEEYFFDPVNFHKAIDALVNQNMRLAHNTASKNYIGEDWDERQEICQEKLLDSAYGFDPERGVRFSTYAVTAMRHGMRQVFSKAGDKKERHQDFVIDRERELKKAWHHADQNRAINIKEDLPKELRYALRLILSPGKKGTNAELPFSLNLREISILRMRFQDAQTLRSVAETLSLSKERVRQLQVGAIGKIKKGIVALTNN